MNLKTIHYRSHRNNLQKFYADRIGAFALVKRFPYNHGWAREM